MEDPMKLVYVLVATSVILALTVMFLIGVFISRFM